MRTCFKKEKLLDFSRFPLPSPENEHTYTHTSVFAEANFVDHAMDWFPKDSQIKTQDGLGN